MSVDFALVGHQESWRAASDVLALLRGPGRPAIPDDEVPEILPWVPARAVCHIEARSIRGGSARGLYIDSFISPDRLGSPFLRENLVRIRDAVACARRAKAKIVSLGGFSSILVEGNRDLIPEDAETVFTTGNSLTVGFIVQGIKEMCLREGKDLRSLTLLIVGATGDVGSGCARCLAPHVRRVLLHARNPERLQNLAKELRDGGAMVAVSPDLRDPSVRADLVLCAASLPSPTLLLDCVEPEAIVCDAGYPKNLSPGSTGAKVFAGGLGQVTAGIAFEPDIHSILYRGHAPHVLHGCLLEGIALALENRFEPFSRGRGRITPESVAEIEAIATRHGIGLAPLRSEEGQPETPSHVSAALKEVSCLEIQSLTLRRQVHL